MQQLLLDIRPPARPELARFVAGRNIELMAQLAAMLDGSAAERMVYLWGAPGSGKSYLLAAWAHACQKLGMTVDFSGKQAAQAVIADQVEAWNEAQQHAGFAAFNRVRESGGLWLAAGSVAPAELPVMPELQTRLGWGLVFQLQGLEDAEKRTALMQHAETLGFRLESQVADYLLNHTARDMQSLLRVLEALDRFSLETRRPITLPLLRQLLLNQA
ncbi:MAG TPA: DnaA regulatory inactivator Hda [Archangium sp.]|uniref:DnaA regulatory inactivator Hda n=1 Tax=Archangium sp. TaxID=1872627 RepID=UPI002E2EB7AA|nr:DnaA regulatory inactivator Hda [Archangium sp.]HEX5748863.1 DnaA regulatory inactivator Hda [Archangium sp.]